MAEPPAAAPKLCCVCDAQNGKHCTKCKSRHYCSKKCQLVDWKEGGHKEECKQLAAKFQDRLLEELMPAKLKIKEAPAIVKDIVPAAGLKAHLPAVGPMAAAKANALIDDAPCWRVTCVICLDLLVEDAEQTFYDCCCANICKICSDKCDEYDTRCPLCRAQACTSAAEWLCRMQKHVDKGYAKAQFKLGEAYFHGQGLKKSAKRAFKLYEVAAAQGHAMAQEELGLCYERGNGVKINLKTAALWYRRAADQGYPQAQNVLGLYFYDGKGVAQSCDEAVRWWRLAAAQGHAQAHYYLGMCYANGRGVPRDDNEALRLCKRAVAKGYADAAGMVEALAARATG